jgi:hypothetical protein
MFCETSGILGCDPPEVAINRHREMYRELGLGPSDEIWIVSHA